jgi:hypothetical protein
MKIQRTTTPIDNHAASPSFTSGLGSLVDPFATPAAATVTANLGSSGGFDQDPFAAFDHVPQQPAVSGFASDPFGSAAQTGATGNDFDDLWSSKSAAATNNSVFDTAFASNTVPASNSFSNGFGNNDDWTSAFGGATSNTNASNQQANNFDAFANTNHFEQSSSNAFANDDANWAAFDGIIIN